MYGDTEVMRARVGQLREQAVDIRETAARLVAMSEAAEWQGRAAESMRLRIRERAVALRAAAERHDTAAEALAQHASVVDDLKDTIAETERRAEILIGDARTRVAHLSPDLTDAMLTAFEAPASGHKDWLAVELPGLAGFGR